MKPSTALTRRRFLKQLGIVGAGALALPQIVPSRLIGATTANSKLNIALIGCGGRGRGICPTSENLIAICDVNAERIEAFLAKGGKDKKGGAPVDTSRVRVYEDYRKLLDAEKSLDAVVIAAGQRWHVPLSKTFLLAGKHVFCEKPLAHSVAETREIQDVTAKCRLATQIGSQGGATDTFRRSMEIIQAGLLGQIREVHCWIDRSFPPSAPVDMNGEPIPNGLNWDFWCGPSKLLPFKKYYLGGCLAWGRWLEFGDGHLADMGAHGLNLPWRALKLTTATRVEAFFSEPIKDSYPSKTSFRWDFPARDNMAPVSVWWHDGPQAGPKPEQVAELLPTFGKLPNNGVLFVGEKGMLKSDAWGVGGVMKLKGEPKFRGVNDHEAAKPLPKVYPRTNNHMGEWLNACKGGAPTFQPFTSAAPIAELAMTGIVALRLGKPFEWDSANMKAKGIPEADPLIHREQRKKWLL